MSSHYGEWDEPDDDEFEDESRISDDADWIADWLDMIYEDGYIAALDQQAMQLTFNLLTGGV